MNEAFEIAASDFPVWYRASESSKALVWQVYNTCRNSQYTTQPLATDRDIPSGPWSAETDVAGKGEDTRHKKAPTRDCNTEDGSAVRLAEETNILEVARC